MADGLNKVMIMGFLGADPDLRVLQSGNAVLNMSIACNESYLDRNRVRQERTEWVRVKVWGKRGEALSKFLRKGAQVFVEGKLQTTSYQDREGVKRWSTEVVATNIIVGGSNRPRNQPNDPERGRPNRREHHDEDGGGSNGGGGGGYDDEYDYGSSGGSGGDDEIPF